jgi:hypothetical protein
VRFELTITGFAVQSLWPDLATRARVISNLGFGISDCGAEREIRTLEASLEDSHVSSYIIPACSSFDGAPGGIRTHNLDVRSVAPIQLSFGSSLLRAAPARACCLLVREDRIELSPRVSRTRMLALHHARKIEFCSLSFVLCGWYCQVSLWRAGSTKSKAPRTKH